MFVAVDKVKIFYVIREIPIKVDPIIKEMKTNTLGYKLSGAVTEQFYVPFERCVEVEQEYEIQLNLYGPSKANEWAKNKGYID